MTKKRMKVIGLKVDEDNDKIISLRAMRDSRDKAEVYREIIKEYFEKHPLSQGEKEILGIQ